MNFYYTRKSLRSKFVVYISFTSIICYNLFYGFFVPLGKYSTFLHILVVPAYINPFAGVEDLPQ